MTKRKLMTLILALGFAINVHSQTGQKTAALIECTMLDMSDLEDENGWKLPGVFSLFPKEQRLHFLDTMLQELTGKYALTKVEVLAVDSISYTNSSFKGIGKLRKKDEDMLDGKSYDYYIKIYTVYDLSSGKLLGLGMSNTARATLSVYIAVFDSNKNRIWFPDAKAKDGLAFGNTTKPSTYYNNNKEKADAYQSLLYKALGKIFKKE